MDRESNSMRPHRRYTFPGCCITGLPSIQKFGAHLVISLYKGP